ATNPAVARRLQSHASRGPDRRAWVVRRMPEAPKKQLIGTWKIMAFEDRKDEHDPNSEWTYPYGKNPKGYFVYDNTGHVMIQIMKTPPSRPFASGDDEKPTAEEVKTAFTGYVAYFGTYTVDAGKNVVIHHVE